MDDTNNETNDTLITLEHVLSIDPCYSNKRLAALYKEPVTLVELLTNKKGAWRSVSIRDRVWTLGRLSIYFTPETAHRFRHAGIKAADRFLDNWRINEYSQYIDCAKELVGGELVRSNIEDYRRLRWSDHRYVQGYCEGVIGGLGSSKNPKSIQASRVLHVLRLLAGNPWAFEDVLKDKTFTRHLCDAYKDLPLDFLFDEKATNALKRRMSWGLGDNTSP